MSDSHLLPRSPPRKTGKSGYDIVAHPTVETRKKRAQSLLGLAILLVGGALLFSPVLSTPLFLDDHLQSAMVEGTWPAPRSPYDLYAFIDDSDRAALTARGLLPWWSDPHLTIRFFRPLASALLYVDHRALSHDPWPMHVHSLAWWGLAVIAARALFRKMLAPRPAALATVIFALAPCHALPLAWVANRETLLSLAFGALALVAQASFRDTRRLRDALFAGICFTLALLGGGEYALCFGGYVLAMDLVRRESLAARVSGWLPFLVPAFGYLVLRGVLGYGTAASGFYSDPLHEPQAFFVNAPYRLVAQLATAWITMDTEPWRLGVPRGVLVVLVLGVAFALVLPIRRALAAQQESRRAALLWLLFGSILALLPTLAVVPARRLLGVSMLGVAAIVSILVEHAWFPREGEPKIARGLAASLSMLAGLGLGFAHFVHGPGTSWLACEQHKNDASDFAARVEWVRQRVGDTTKADLGVVRGSPGIFFEPFALDARGRTPAAWRVLTQAGHVLALRRDTLTVDLVAAEGHGLYPLGERNLYRSTAAPLHKGDELAGLGFHVTILETGSAGPRVARFVFDNDPSQVVWLNDMFELTTEVELPSVGFGEPFDP